MSTEAKTMRDVRLGFLGGGAMAGAMIRGFIASKLLKPEQVTIVVIEQYITRIR